MVVKEMAEALMRFVSALTTCLSRYKTAVWMVQQNLDTPSGECSNLWSITQNSFTLTRTAWNVAHVSVCKPVYWAHIQTS